MNLDLLIAQAKERCHRSIGQRARWIRHDLEQAFSALRARYRIQTIFLGGKVRVRGDLQFR